MSSDDADLFTSTAPETPKASDRTTTARDVVAMLQRHYLPEGRPAGGVLAIEIGAPDGTRRADAVWAPFTIAGGDGLIGHEIKVTRSDVLAELADPAKADPWAQYCTQWWLTVSDPALVAGLDIPEAWGIMAPPSGRRTRSMTILRPALRRKVGNTGPAWRRIMSWEHYRLAPALAEARRTVEYRDQRIESLETQLRDRSLAGEGRAHPDAVRVANILRAVGAAAYRHDRRLPASVWVSQDDTTDDDIVAAILDVAATRATAQAARRDLERLVRYAEEMTRPMASVRKALAALEVPAVAQDGAA